MFPSQANRRTPLNILMEFLSNTEPDKVEAAVNQLVAPDATYVSLNFSNPELKKIMPWTGTDKGPRAYSGTFLGVANYWKIDDFTGRHPEFAVQVMEGDRAVRVRLDDKARLKDTAQVKLNHQKHMKVGLQGLDDLAKQGLSHAARLQQTSDDGPGHVSEPPDDGLHDDGDGPKCGARRENCVGILEGEQNSTDRSDGGCQPKRVELCSEDADSRRGGSAFIFPDRYQTSAGRRSTGLCRSRPRRCARTPP